MDSGNTYWADRAALEWQLELGATDAITDAPLDRYALDSAAPAVAPAPAPRLAAPAADDAVGIAHAAAAAATDLPGLFAAITAYSHCDIRQGARNAVFAAGQPGARVMIVGDAPSVAEDREGAPFAGPEGQLLDRMLAAIDLARAHDNPARGVYLTTALPWRTPADRPLHDDEIAMLTPFLERHIQLAAPAVIVLMGNSPCQMLLGAKSVAAQRGGWVSVLDRPCLPMVHPAYLLRNPAAKRTAWADLLTLNARLAS